MKLRINGNEESIEVKTIKEIIDLKELNIDHIVIEHNLKVLPKDKWETTELNENDNLEIISFVGGG